MPKIPKRKLTYLGIDPGQSGGLVALFWDGKVTEALSMPTTERDIWNFFLGYGGLGTTVALIEQVHSMPGQGVASMFKFGMGYGGLRMALIAASIPFEQITPQKWQKYYSMARKKGEPKDHYKQRLRAKAQELFPQQEVTLKTADALLIALYCQRKHEGRL